MDKDTVAVTRFCPEINQSIVLVARSCFNEPKITDIPTSYNPAQGTGFVKPLMVEGKSEIR